MIKKIMLMFALFIASVFIGSLVLYNESLKGVKITINNAIENDDYSSLIAYSEYYINEPIYEESNNQYDIQIYNSYDDDVQLLTFIVVDKSLSKGESSKLEITCNDSFIYNDIFYKIDSHNISVVSIYKDGDTEFSLNGTCSLENFSNVVILLNDGTEILNLNNEIGFISDDEIIQNGVQGYSEEDMKDIQYPNGIIIPILIPVTILWVSVYGSIFIYKKIIKNKKKENK